MNKFQCLLFSLFTGFTPSLLTQECRFPPPVEGEYWDVFWAQHYVGADLLREELKQQNIRNDDLYSLVGIWDAPYKNHGEYVSQIIAGPRASAVIPINDPLPFQMPFQRMINLFRREDYPSYINYSMRWDLTMSPITSYLSTRGVTFVIAAGNHKMPLSLSLTETSLNKKAIVVSSLTPLGFPSKFTGYGAVTVSAPSNNSIRSYDYEGNATFFGGTSGATSLVTGTLAGFTLLSRHHLTVRQADYLLRKTAIPLPRLPRKHLLGAGMLNAYKIGRVALRIREQCQRDPSGFRRDECLSNLLESKQTYHFSEMSDRFFREAQASFEETSSVDDCKKTEAFSNLRRAFLLNPTNVEVLKYLIDVRRKYFGYSLHGAFYQSLLSTLQKEEEEIIEHICQKEIYSSL